MDEINTAPQLNPEQNQPPEPQPLQQPASELFRADPVMPTPVPKRKRRTPIVVLILLLLLAGTFTGLELGGVTHFIKKADQKLVVAADPSLTVYYRDGKTVLWQDDATNTNSSTDNGTAPFFVAAVKQVLKDKYSEDYYKKGAWKVTTTLDKAIQDSGIAAFATQKDIGTKQGVKNTAFAVEDVTNGQIMAWYSESSADVVIKSVDNITKAVTPGSAILPFDYSALFDKTTINGAGSTVDDVQGALSGYPCTDTTAGKGNCLFNFDRTYGGKMTYRYALGGLRQVPAAKAGLEVGVKTVQSLFNDSSSQNAFACTEPASEKVAECYAAAALGEGITIKPTNMLAAYATLANNGKRLPQSLVLTISLNDKQEYEWKADAAKQAIRADAAYIVNDILSDPKASVYGKSKPELFLSNGSTTAVAAGATNTNMAGSIIGYSSKYVSGVWVDGDGATIASALNNVPLVIFESVSETAHKNVSALKFTSPAGIKTLPTYVMTTSFSTLSGFPSRDTDLYPSWYTGTGSR